MNMDFFGMFDFAAGDDDTYKYTSAEFSTLIEALTGNGVSTLYGNALRPSFTEGSLNVSIETGACFINGRYGYVSSAKTLTAVPTPSGESRKDIVAATLDLENRIIMLEIVEGTAEDYPTLTENQIPLAEIVVNNTDGAKIESLNDVRSFVYTSSQFPSIQVIYSQTVPAYVEGAIWLKPQMVQ